MDLPILNEFYLVGGTALALQLGHRKSIDLDLFAGKEIPEEEILASIAGKEVDVFARSSSFLGLIIDGIKVDFVKYPFALILPLVVEDGIRMAAPLEIAAMKLWAITKRGSKKDFYDLHLLLQHYSLEETFEFFSRKFPQATTFMVLKSLTYFVDAEDNVDPEMFLSLTWEDVKTSIVKEVTAVKRKGI